MAVERAPGGTSLIDVLDRVLDKKYSEAVGLTPPRGARELAPLSPTQLEMDRVLAESAAPTRQLEALS